MDNTNGWDVLTKAEEVSTRLRVRHLEDQPLSSLSGGERKRVALAALVLFTLCIAVIHFILSLANKSSRLGSHSMVERFNQ